MKAANQQWHGKLQPLLESQTPLSTLKLSFFKLSFFKLSFFKLSLRSTIRNLQFVILFTFTALLSGCAWVDSIFGTEPQLPAPPITVPILAAPAAQSGVPNQLVLPTLNANIRVVELGWSVSQNLEGGIFSQWDVADFAAGWHKNSALAGQKGNVVLSGHNNVKGAVFRELDQLKKGDEIVLWSNGRKFSYEVDKVLIVPEKYATVNQRRKNADYIEPTEDKRLTLVSCWPRDDNTHRIIVVAFPRLEATAQK